MDTTQQIAEAIKDHEARLHRRNGRPKKIKNLAGFNDFWEIWPRKVAKKPAQERWAEINPDEQLAERIIAAVQAQKAAGILNIGEFTPYPATWLNAGRWTDELPKDAERVSRRRSEADANARKQEREHQDAAMKAQKELEFAERVREMTDSDLEKLWKMLPKLHGHREKVEKLRPDRKELFDRLKAEVR